MIDPETTESEAAILQQLEDEEPSHHLVADPDLSGTFEVPLVDQDGNPIYES